MMPRIERATGKASAAAPMGRRAQRRAETRARIVKAALKLFARQGFSATTVEQITQAADVGKGTFFNYFPSKEHALAGFGDFQLAKIRQAFEQAQAPSVSVAPCLRQLLRSLAEVPGRSPELVRSFLLVLVSSGNVRALMRRKLGEGRKLLIGLVTLGQDRSEIRRELVAAAVARQLQQMFFGGLCLWTLHPTTKLANWIEPAFESFWRSVCVREDSQTGR